MLKAEIALVKLEFEQAKSNWERVAADAFVNSNSLAMAKFGIMPAKMTTKQREQLVIDDPEVQAAQEVMFEIQKKLIFIEKSEEEARMELKFSTDGKVLLESLANINITIGKSEETADTVYTEIEQQVNILVENMEEYRDALDTKSGSHDPEFWLDLKENFTIYKSLLSGYISTMSIISRRMSDKNCLSILRDFNAHLKNLREDTKSFISLADNRIWRG